MGLLWWNLPSGQILLGRGGAAAIGGAIGTISIVTGTELLAIPLFALLLADPLSTVIQVGGKVIAHRAVFRSSPLSQNLRIRRGWHTSTILVRTWSIGGIIAAGAVTFYLYLR